ncbi:hypothetical protein Tco_0078480 [Tanacetum coccineum]
MDITKDDQIALDDALVAPVDRLKIGKCNIRLSTDVASKEATLQVVYDVDILQICPKVGNKKFEEPPLEKEILAFLASLGHSGEIRKITDVNVNKLHQPWRSFAAIINKCLSGKPSYDSLRLSQAQILWGMYNNKKVDYAYLLWEDFTYQIENKNTKKGNAMYYPRFTKLIVNFVMAKDPSIPRRNKVNWHYARDDPMFTTINVISRNEDTQLYGAILPAELTNEDIRNSESYKEYYAIASGKIPPKTKASKKKTDSDAPTKQKSPTVPKEKKGKKSGKGKQKAKELETISEAVLTEAEQLKIITKRSRKETHSSHASGSGADEGTGVSPGVPDAPDYDSDDDISWKSSEDDQDDDKNADDENDHDDEDDDKNADDENDQDDEDDDKNDDDENVQDDDDEAQTETEDDGDDFIHPKLTTHDDETTHILKRTDKMIPFREQSRNVDAHLKKEDQGNEADKDTNANLEGRDDVMTDVVLPQVQATQEIEDTHVTLTPVNPDGQQQSSSVSSGFVLVRSSKGSQDSHAVAANLSELELKKILIDKIEANNSINKSDIQRQLYKALVDAYEADKILLDTYGDTVTIKRPRDGADDDQEPSAGTDRGSKRRSGKEPESTSAPRETTTTKAGKTTTGSKTHKQSASQSTPVEDTMKTTDVFEAHAHQEFETDVHDEQAEEEVQHLPDWFQQPKRLPSLDHAWNKSVPAIHESIQPWLSNLARRQDPRESFDELTDTTFEFSAFRLTELEYFCEEVYKATTEKLDSINPEGRQYPHDMRQPLPLVPNSQGRHVIPFHHFINNDLEYLRGVKYDKLAPWGSHMGQKANSSYAFATTRESARDSYSKRRIIAVKREEIVERHKDKHLDWITVRRDDDILYKFKEGDFQRLRIQDIKDMLLLLVQGKVTNLNVEEQQHLIHILRSQRISNYENKDKRTDLAIYELHNFSDGTLDEFGTALNDHLKGIRMEYLPQTFWSQRDKANARAMIQAIDKRLKTRRIMRSLERFVGGRPYGEVGIIATEMELTLEQTQQGVSYEVSVDPPDLKVPQPTPG